MSELTRRERQVIGHISHGLTTKEIAAALGVAEPTVKFHVTNLLRKLGAKSRSEAIAIALTRGWMPAEPADASDARRPYRRKTKPIFPKV